MIFEVIVAEGAEVVARYGEDFYAGEPAVTLNRRAVSDSPLVEGVEGHAWYIGTQLDHEGLSHIMRSVLARHDLVGPYADLPYVELATRIAPSGIKFDFIINHSAEPVEITLHADGHHPWRHRPDHRPELNDPQPLGVAGPIYPG